LLASIRRKSLFLVRNAREMRIRAQNARAAWPIRSTNLMNILNIYNLRITISLNRTFTSIQQLPCQSRPRKFPSRSPRRPRQSCLVLQHTCSVLGHYAAKLYTILEPSVYGGLSPPAKRCRRFAAGTLQCIAYVRPQGAQTRSRGESRRKPPDITTEINSSPDGLKNRHRR
jgi:hypothetical protein